MLIDAHIHIQFPAYDGDREDVIRRAREAGVKMVAVGTQETTSRAAIACAEANPGLVWATVGFHPNHVVGERALRAEAPQSGAKVWHHDPKEQTNKKPETFDYGTFEALARHPKVVAIGECGLDYYRLPSDKGQATRDKERQKEVFLAQAEIATGIGKALMIHCRPSKGTDDAYEDLLAIISKSKFQNPKIVHFYVGSLVVTKKLISAGFYFTFGGVITFARDYDEVIRLIPLDRILTETDAPYVAPEPYRGKRNEPAYVLETTRKLAALKEVSLETIEEAVTRNAMHIFRIN